MDLEAVVHVIALVEEDNLAQIARHWLLLRGFVEVLGSVRHQRSAIDNLVAQRARHLGAHLAPVASCHVHRESCYVEVLEAVGAEDALLPSFAGVQNQDVILVVAHVRDFVREIRQRVS
jgi:hypothetical protein